MKPLYHIPKLPPPPDGVLALPSVSASLNLQRLQDHVVLCGPAAQTLALQADWLEQAASHGLKTLILPAKGDTTLSHLGTALRLQQEWVHTLLLLADGATLRELLRALLDWTAGERNLPPLLVFIGRGYTSQQLEVIHMAEDLKNAGLCIIADIETGLLHPAWSQNAQTFILYPPAIEQARYALQAELPDLACWYRPGQGCTLLTEDR